MGSRRAHTNGTATDHLTGKRQHLLLLWGEVPVHIGELIVLAVGVIVTLLSTQHLITHEQHWGTHGKYSQSNHVLALA